MAKSPPRGSFDYVLTQAISGGETERLALCKRLADRLLIVPVVGSFEKMPSLVRTEASIRVVTISEAESQWVPVFSSVESFKSWAVGADHKGDLISILGSDLVLSLGSEIGLVLDIGSEFNLRLSPYYLEQAGVAKLDVAGSLLTSKENPPVIPPDGFKSGKAGPKGADPRGAEGRLRPSNAKLL